MDSPSVVSGVSMAGEQYELQIKVQWLDNIPAQDEEIYEFKYEIRRGRDKGAAPLRECEWCGGRDGKVAWGPKHIIEDGKPGAKFHSVAGVRPQQDGQSGSSIIVHVRYRLKDREVEQEGELVETDEGDYYMLQGAAGIKFRVPPFTDDMKERSNKFKIQHPKDERRESENPHKLHLKVSLRVAKAAPPAQPSRRGDAAQTPARQPRGGQYLNSAALGLQDRGSDAKSPDHQPSCVSGRSAGSALRPRLDPAILAASDHDQAVPKSEMSQWEKGKMWSTDWHPWELYSLYCFFTRNIETLCGASVELHQLKEFCTRCPCFFHGDAWETWFRDPMVIEVTIDGTILTENEHGNFDDLQVDEERMTRMLKFDPDVRVNTARNAWLMDHGLIDDPNYYQQPASEKRRHEHWEIIAVHFCGPSSRTPVRPTDNPDQPAPDIKKGNDGWRDHPVLNSSPEGEGSVVEAMEEVRDRLRHGEIVQLLLQPPPQKTNEFSLIPHRLLNTQPSWDDDEDRRKYTMRWTLHPEGDQSHKLEDDHMKPTDDHDKGDADQAGVRLYGGAGKAEYVGYHMDGIKRSSVVLGGPPTARSKGGEDTWARGCPVCTYIFEPQCHWDVKTRTYSRVPTPANAFESWHWPRRKVGQLFKLIMRRVKSARAGRVGKGDHGMTPFELCKALFKLIGECRDVQGMRIRSGPFLQAQLIFKAFDFDRGGALEKQELVAMIGAIGGINARAGEEEVRNMFDKLGSTEDPTECVFESEQAYLDSNEWISKLTLARVLDLVASNPKHDFAKLVFNFAHVTTWRLMRPQNKFALCLGQMPCCGGWDPPVNPLEYPDNKALDTDPLDRWDIWSWWVDPMPPFTDEAPGGATSAPTAQELYALYVAFLVMTDDDENWDKDTFLNKLLVGSSGGIGDVEVRHEEKPGYILSKQRAKELGFTNELTVNSDTMMTIHLKNIWLSCKPKMLYCGFRRTLPPQRVPVWEKDAQQNEVPQKPYCALPNTLYENTRAGTTGKECPHGFSGKKDEAEEEDDDKPPERCPPMTKLHFPDRGNHRHIGDARREWLHEAFSLRAQTDGYTECPHLGDGARSAWRPFQAPQDQAGGAAEHNEAEVGAKTLRMQFHAKKHSFEGDWFSGFGLAPNLPEILLVAPLGPFGLVASAPDQRRVYISKVNGENIQRSEQGRGRLQELLSNAAGKVAFEVDIEQNVLSCSRCLSADVHVEIDVVRLQHLKKKSKRPMVLGIIEDANPDVHPDDPESREYTEKSWDMFGVKWQHASSRGGVKVCEGVEGKVKSDGVLYSQERVMVHSDSGGEMLAKTYGVDVSDRELRYVWLRRKDDHGSEDNATSFITVGEKEPELPESVRLSRHVRHVHNGEELIDALSCVVLSTKIIHPHTGRQTDFIHGDKITSVVFTFGPQLVSKACQDICHFPQAISAYARRRERVPPPLEGEREKEKDQHLRQCLWEPGHDILCPNCVAHTFDDERVIDRSKADSLFNKLDVESGNGDGELSGDELLYGVLDALGKLDREGGAREAGQAKQLFVEVFFAVVDKDEGGTLQEFELREQLGDIVRSYSYADQRDTDAEAHERTEMLFTDLGIAWEQPEAQARRDMWDEERKKVTKRNLRDRMLDKELLTLLLEYKEEGRETAKWGFLIPYFAHKITYQRGAAEKVKCYFKECIWCHKCGGCIQCDWRESCDDGNCKKLQCCICDCCKLIDLEVDDIPKPHCMSWFKPSVLCC